MAAAILLVLFARLTGAIAVMALPVLLLIFMALNVRTILSQLSVSAALLTLPLLSLASTLWSALPGTTFYYAIQYLLTALLGIMVGSNRNRPVVYGLLAAFFLHALASIAFGRFGEWGGDLMAGRGGVAFLGLMGSKNSSADAAAIGLLVAMTGLIQALSDRKALPALAAIVMVPVDLWILKNAHSTGALVVFILGATALITMSLGRILPKSTRMAVFLLLGLSLTGAAATQHLWLEPVLDTVADASGKDRTLTGRTFIWARADYSIRTHPTTGVGYAGFWQRGNLEAQAIWRELGVGAQGPFAFNFHNTPREITVHLGLVGLILYFVVALASAIALYTRTTLAPTAYAIFNCSYLVMVIPRLGVESVGFTPISITTTLIFAALSSAWQRRNRKPGRQAIPMRH